MLSTGDLCVSRPIQIRTIERVCEIPHEGPFCDLMWSDPEETETWAVSPRGAGWLFGARVAAEFNQINGLELICRAHQLVQEGLKYMFPPVSNAMKRKRKEKTMPFGVNQMRSQVLYWATQEARLCIDLDLLKSKSMHVGFVGSSACTIILCKMHATHLHVAALFIACASREGHSVTQTCSPL